MLAALGTIDDVKPTRFIVQGNFMLVLKRDGITCKLLGYEAEEKRWEKTIEGKLSIGFRYRDTVIIGDYKKRLLQIDIKDGTIVNEIEGDFSPIRSIGDRFLISKFTGHVYCPGLYSSNFKPLWQSSMLPFFHQSTNVDLLLGFPRLKQPTVVDYAFFTMYDTENGQENWSHDVSGYSHWVDLLGTRHEVEVSKFFGVSNEDLWVGLNNGKVLVLNVRTGELKHVIGNPYFSYLYENDVFPSTNAMVMDHKNDRVIGLFMYSYWEVDVQTFRVDHVDLEHHFIQAAIHSDGISAMDDNFIYFMDSENGKVGVFSRETRQLVWNYTFPPRDDSKTFPVELQKHGDHIYVLDNNHKLHVFNKTA